MRGKTGALRSAPGPFQFNQSIKWLWQVGTFDQGQETAPFWNRCINWQQYNNFCIKSIFWQYVNIMEIFLFARRFASSSGRVLESVLNIDRWAFSSTKLQIIAKLLHPWCIIGYNVSSLPSLYLFQCTTICSSEGSIFSSFPHVMTLKASYISIICTHNRWNIVVGT